MTNDLEATAQIIDQEIAAFRARLFETFNANFDKYGIVESGRLQSATKIDQNQIADDLVGGIEILTLKYGIQLQSKKPFVVKARAEDIIEWVKSLGLARFKQLPGKVPTEDAAIRRIAWGIKQHGRARKQGTESLINNKSKSRVSDPWLYRPFYAELKVFKDNLATRISPTFAKDVANAIGRSLTSRTTYSK